jgi:hypothetical protein
MTSSCITRDLTNALGTKRFSLIALGTWTTNTDTLMQMADDTNWTT